MFNRLKINISQSNHQIFYLINEMINKNPFTFFCFLMSFIAFLIFILSYQFLGDISYIYLAIGILCISPIIIRYHIVSAVLLCLIIFSGITAALGRIYKPMVLFSIILVIYKYLFDKNYKFHWTFAHSALAIYFFVSVFSILFSFYYDFTFQELYALIRVSVVFWVIIELVLISSQQNRKITLLLIINAIIIGCIINSVYMIFIFVNQPVIYTLLAQGQSYLRTGGWIQDPNDLAAMLLMSLGLLYPLLKNSKNVILKSWYILSSIIIIVSLVLTLSRGGMIGFVFLLLLILWNERKSKKLWIVLSIIFILFIIIFGDLVISRIETFSNLGSSRDKSFFLRTSLYKLSLNEVTLSPIFGIGLGDFRLISTHYFSNHDLYFPVAHNAFLHIAVETGLIGLVSYLLIFIAVYYLLFKSRLFALKNGLNSYSKYPESLLYALSAFFIPALFLSIHHKYFIFAYLAIGTGVALNILIGGKVGKRL